ncbi:MAG TPA: 3-oxoacyl-[acyl-carrier-protein] synthase III C-terminal domain-containing protein [Candidatus Binataceae bacterium]|nr:3-oxoacyl-[acyl-carrier-protein] synthase III C-terminal domain-containing protein [Candidatus Binataceae bacterium]
MRIASVASAFPPNVYTQQEITNALKERWGDKLAKPEVLDRLHANCGVRKRHLSFTFDRYLQFKTWGESNRAWLEVAQDLGEQAIDGALKRADLTRADLNAIFFVSITGVASPSLDAKLVNRMGLRSDIKRTPIFGLGCVGGAIGLTRAADYVRAYPNENAVLLSVELCSLTIQLGDVAMPNIIATGLFGDGAVATIVGPQAGTGPEILASKSVFYPETEDIMGWDVSEKGFGIILSARLPDLIRARLRSDVDSFLASHKLSRSDLGSFVLHPGGPKILQAVEEALELKNCELAPSWDCLARYGNLSSGSVLIVLEEVMQRRRPVPGTLGLVMAMGPGFCSEMVLIRW